MTGFMSKPTGNQTILEDLRNRLATNVSRDAETLLASMPEAQQNAILMMAKEADRAMRFSRISAAQAITRLYPNADIDKRKVILALLNAEEDRPDFAAQDAAMDRAYAQWERLKPLEELLAETPSFRSSRSSASSQTEALISRPQRPTPTYTSNDNTADASSFMAALTASESGGRADAEYTTRDGRRHVGLLQFSEARLQDFRNATGETFTQDEFAQDVELQSRVGDWHVASIDAAIDDLGEAAAGLDRDGLRAVAHLGGEAGMRRFVRTNGGYNPSDELGTSLSDYYARFSSGAS
ncbi:hypothetical protein [Roseobacter sp. HKCCA0882]|uniref:hypothetical protein n=1 Tax=Roseobacter sp. HKCCA0882 TaxID=3120337 RepID=UPI001DAA1E3F|nr:hypothetical protein [Rhodobacterales bacterium HKCCD6035]